jgi:hypothetical protein
MRARAHQAEKSQRQSGVQVSSIARVSLSCWCWTPAHGDGAEWATKPSVRWERERNWFAISER